MRKSSPGSILLVLFCFLFLQSACEKDITLDLPEPEDKLVVEGFVEPGMPVYAILTKNTSFFSPIGFETFDKLFVRDADVTVSDGFEVVKLNEYCLSTLPPAIKKSVFEMLGFDDHQFLPGDFCVYASFEMTGQMGRSYKLEINSEYGEVSAITSVPPTISIDSLWVRPHGSPGDSLVALWMRVTDPDTLGNYYRYFTKVNNEPYYPGYFGSVIDDKFINGQSADFQLERGYPRNTQIDFSTYGLFRKGDTVIVKLAMIDEDHYNFWRTIEQQILSGGPFASPTYIKSNIEGGLGIWGGYSSIPDTLIVR